MDLWSNIIAMDQEYTFPLMQCLFEARKIGSLSGLALVGPLLRQKLRLTSADFGLQEF